jgi:hypothetical protein
LVNPPGGQNNYLPINNPMWTGAGAGPTLNLTGPAPSLTFSGVALGGACPANEFMISLSNTVVPTCAAITSIPGPVTINNPTFTGTVTGPDGGTWSNTGISLPTTSSITVGTVNITGTAPSLTFAGIPMGGSCTGNDFVNAISATGVPSCATPAGGGGGLPTPVSIANGGLGQGNAPSVGQILVATSATVYSPVPMSGNAIISSTGAVTITSLPSGLTINNPTITGTLTLPAGSVTDADLANAYSGVGNCTAGEFVTALTRNAAPTCAAIATGIYAPYTNPTGGQNNYAPIASPTFTGAVAAPTLNLTGTAPALTFSGVAMGGSCAAGAFVSSISNAGVPTCGASLATLYAPLTNPTGGQNNYAPIASPTFTGTTTAPTLAVTGTLTFPDGATWTTAGLNNGTYLGIGAPANATNAIYAYSNTNTQQPLFLIANPNAGSNVTIGLQINTGTGSNIYPTSLTATGSGFSGSNPWPASSAQLLTSGPGGLWLGTNNQAIPIVFSQGATVAARITNAQWTFNNASTPASLFIFPFGSLTSIASGTGMGPSSLQLAAGTHFNGTSWIADQANAVIMNLKPDTAQILRYENTGLTVGAAFTPTAVDGENVGWAPTFTFTGGISGAVNNGSYGIYQKYGKMVLVTFGVIYSSVGTGSGNAEVCGFPFPTNSNGNQGTFLLGNFGTNFTSAVNGPVYIAAGGNVSCWSLNYYPSGSAVGAVLPASVFTGAVNLQGSFVYATN